VAKRAGLSRDDVIDAAVELVDTEGLDALTLVAVATKLGVQPPSLYHHVDGLDGLRVAVGVEGVRRLADRFQAAVQGMTGLPALRAMAVAFRDFARAHRGLYLAAQPATSLDADRWLYEAAPEAFDTVVAAMASLGLDADDQVHVIRSVRASLHGFIMLEQRAGFGTPDEVETSFTRMLDLLEGGVRMLLTNEAAHDGHPT
jgi:AcrR family transcriptional regulator